MMLLKLRGWIVLAIIVTVACIFVGPRIWPARARFHQNIQTANTARNRTESSSHSEKDGDQDSATPQIPPGKSGAPHTLEMRIRHAEEQSIQCAVRLRELGKQIEGLNEEILAKVKEFTAMDTRKRRDEAWSKARDLFDSVRAGTNHGSIIKEHENDYESWEVVVNKLSRREDRLLSTAAELERMEAFRRLRESQEDEALDRIMAWEREALLLKSMRTRTGVSPSGN